MRRDNGCQGSLRGLAVLMSLEIAGYLAAMRPRGRCRMSFCCSPHDELGINLLWTELFGGCRRLLSRRPSSRRTTSMRPAAAARPRRRNGRLRVAAPHWVGTPLVLSAAAVFRYQIISAVKGPRAVGPVRCRRARGRRAAPRPHAFTGLAPEGGLRRYSRRSEPVGCASDRDPWAPPARVASVSPVHRASGDRSP